MHDLLVFMTLPGIVLLLMYKINKILRMDFFSKLVVQQFIQEEQRVRVSTNLLSFSYSTKIFTECGESIQVDASTAGIEGKRGILVYPNTHSVTGLQYI